MAKIAIDVDDTLYSFRDAARDELVRRSLSYGDTLEDQAERDIYSRAAYSTWTDWRTPHDLLGHRWVDVIDSCHEDAVILSRQPFAEANNVIWELADEGHEIMYITSRKEPTRKATLQWLHNHEFPYPGGLVVCGPDKSEYLKNCSALIDDRPRTIIKYLYQPAPVAHFAFVKAGEWNHNLTDVPGCYVSPTWLGIREGLRKKGFLS